MPLARFEHDFTDASGNVLTGVGTVTVRREDTSVLASPYSDRDGTVALGNPFSVTGGAIAFHVVGGPYRIDIAFGAETRTLRYVAIGTAAEQDAETLSFAGLSYQFEAATAAPPSAGSIRADNADLSLATKLYIANETLGGSDFSATIVGLDPGANANLNTLYLRVNATDTSFKVSGATPQSGYIEIDVSGHDGSTALDAGTCKLTIERSAEDGADGNDGGDGSDGIDGADGIDGGGMVGIVCRAVSETNIDLSTALENSDSAGGVTLATSDVFGAFGQTDASQNGIYVVQATGAAVRHAAFDAYDENCGGVFTVSEGTNAGKIYQCTSAKGGTLDTTNLVFVDAVGTGALIGSSAIWNTNAPPTGWLEEDGSAISRTTYADLFAVIGTTFGVGDGSTTFNIPDMRGEFVRGWDNGRGIDSSRAFGSFQDHELESHIHTIDSRSNAGNFGGQVLARGNAAANNTRNTDATGGDETRPRNIAKMYIIKY